MLRLRRGRSGGRRRLWLILTVVLLVAVALPLAGAYGIYAYAPAAVTGPGGPNALWAAHEWVGRSHAASDYDDLVAELNRHEVADVYVHVGPLTADGHIPPERYPNAAALVREIRSRDPSIRLQAWIGQVERQGGGPLEVSDPKTRANIVRTAEIFVRLGFE